MLAIFEIFSGRFGDKDALWIETCEGLAESYQKMLQIAADTPGTYFVLSGYDLTCVASIDTSKFLENEKAQPPRTDLLKELHHLLTLPRHCRPL